jgi:hypothetical protein
VSALASPQGFDPSSPSDWLIFAMFGVVIIGGLTLTIVRTRRSMKPREHQMAVLAGELDGRSQVYFLKMEIGLTQEDLLRVAYSRGYSLIDHRIGKYYEFVYTPHQPGRWQR